MCSTLKLSYTLHSMCCNFITFTYILHMCMLRNISCLKKQTVTYELDSNLMQVKKLVVSGVNMIRFLDFLT